MSASESTILRKETAVEQSYGLTQAAREVRRKKGNAASRSDHQDTDNETQRRRDTEMLPVRFCLAKDRSISCRNFRIARIILSGGGERGGERGGEGGGAPKGR